MPGVPKNDTSDVDFNCHDDDKLLDVPEMLERGGFGRTTLYRESKEGSIKLLKVRNRTFCTRGEWRRYLRSRLSR